MIFRWIKDYYRSLSYVKEQSDFWGERREDVFTKIYEINYWGGTESASGPGSSVEFASEIIPELEKILARFNIRVLLDIPCGDFNWMRRVDLAKIEYVGCDIVESIIMKNNAQYGGDGRVFYQRDLVEDNLPNADLLFNRDCLVHLSYEDIFLVLKNIQRTNIKYLMTTSFRDHLVNHDIVTGDWRPLNLEKFPFNFPAPRAVINEKMPEEFRHEDRNKILGLWKVQELNLT